MSGKYVVIHITRSLYPPTDKYWNKHTYFLCLWSILVVRMKFMFNFRYFDKIQTVMRTINYHLGLRISFLLSLRWRGGGKQERHLVSSVRLRAMSLLYTIQNILHKSNHKWLLRFMTEDIVVGKTTIREKQQLKWYIGKLFNFIYSGTHR